MTDLTRREALAGAATGALATGAPPSLFRRRSPRVPLAPGHDFPQGVVSGFAGDGRAAALDPARPDDRHGAARRSRWRATRASPT